MAWQAARSSMATTENVGNIFKVQEGKTSTTTTCVHSYSKSVAAASFFAHNVDELLDQNSESGYFANQGFGLGPPFSNRRSCWLSIHMWIGFRYWYLWFYWYLRVVPCLFLLEKVTCSLPLNFPCEIQSVCGNQYRKSCLQVAIKLSMWNSFRLYELIQKKLLATCL